MKKMTLTLFAISTLLLMACSSDSGSGNPLNSGEGIISVPVNVEQSNPSAE